MRALSTSQRTFPPWVTVALSLSILTVMCAEVGVSQRYDGRSAKKTKQAAAKTISGEVERTITTICRERLHDSRASLPIDEMAARPSISLTDPRAVAGANRARALLPVAKRLVPFALTKIAARQDLEPLSLRWIIDRVRVVNSIKADVSEHDNAVWRASEPDTITVGTVLLAGLRSDEALIAVLAHELTHAVDGHDRSLQPIFTRIGDKASVVFGNPRVAAELVCELVAFEVVRDHISQTPNQGKAARRLARFFQKDCVQKDLADATHLSPRTTFKTLLTLEPNISKALGGGSVKQTIQRKKVSKKRRGKRTRRGIRNFVGARAVHVPESAAYCAEESDRQTGSPQVITCNFEIQDPPGQI